MNKINHPVLDELQFGELSMVAYEPKINWRFDTLFPVQIQRPESVVRMETCCADESPKLEGNNHSIAIIDDFGKLTITGEFEAEFNDPAVWEAWRKQARTSKARRVNRRTLRVIARQYAMFGHNEQARAILKKARNG